jgi:Holliday junction resolvasome RuvABC DNA-binding subunit
MDYSNNEGGLFLIGLIIFGIPFIISLLYFANQPKVKKEFTIVTHTETISLSNDDGVVEEAKKILVSIGYTATEAKRLIADSGRHNTVEDLVQSVIMRTKV